MKKIRTFFQPYINVSELSETIADGEIQKVEINQQIRMLSLQVSFLDLVQRKDLFALEKAICFLIFQKNVFQKIISMRFFVS